MKSIAFTGHRKCDEVVVREMMKQFLCALLSKDDRLLFICGGAVGVDTIAAEEILKLRDGDCDGGRIELHLFLPCKDQDRFWSGEYKGRFRGVLARANSIKYICDQYDISCMERRNRAMVDASDLVCAYWERTRGGTNNTIAYSLGFKPNVYKERKTVWWLNSEVGGRKLSRDEYEKLMNKNWGRE